MATAYLSPEAQKGGPHRLSKDLKITIARPKHILDFDPNHDEAPFLIAFISICFLGFKFFPEKFLNLAAGLGNNGYAMPQYGLSSCVLLLHCKESVLSLPLQEALMKRCIKHRSHV